MVRIDKAKTNTTSDKLSFNTHTSNNSYYILNHLILDDAHHLKFNESTDNNTFQLVLALTFAMTRNEQLNVRNVYSHHKPPTIRIILQHPSSSLYQTLNEIVIQLLINL